MAYSIKLGAVGLVVFILVVLSLGIVFHGSRWVEGLEGNEDPEQAMCENIQCEPGKKCQDGQCV